MLFLADKVQGFGKNYSILSEVKDRQLAFLKDDKLRHKKMVHSHE